MTLVLFTLDFIFQALRKQACATVPTCVDGWLFYASFTLSEEKGEVDGGRKRASLPYISISHGISSYSKTKHLFSY